MWRLRTLPWLCIAAALVLTARGAQAADPASNQSDAPTRDTTYIAPDGTAYITRIVPVPQTVSPEAQAKIAERVPDSKFVRSLAESRAAFDKARQKNGKLALEAYPAVVADSTIAGVSVTLITPPDGIIANPFVLINVHGGGLELDCCSLVESIPVASLMKSQVISVLYRLAPEYTFPAAVDDVLAVYKEVLKTHRPDQVVIYGTSSGAVITGEVAMKLKSLGLPQPAALGIFSGFGDFTRGGDSLSFFTGGGLGGYLEPPAGLRENAKDYVGSTKLDDPLLSPVMGDLSDLPPTLFLTSTRDWFLSGTSLFHRAMLRAGDKPELVVFEGLGHAFWVNPSLPESDEAYRIMVGFFKANLSSLPPAHLPARQAH